METRETWHYRLCRFSADKGFAESRVIFRPRRLPEVIGLAWLEEEVDDVDELEVSDEDGLLIFELLLTDSLTMVKRSHLLVSLNLARVVRVC